jgi:DNA-binding transcriptional MerR regulator
MKSIAQMAKDLDISSSTIREYLSRFEEFFPDPVEHEGLKEYPPEAQDLIKKIYSYYQTSGMTKDEIRIKLGGASVSPDQPGTAIMAPMDMAQFGVLGETMERLIATVENLTAAITGANVETFKTIKKQASSHEKISEINKQLTDIIELTGEDGEKGDNLEKNVVDTDGTVVFSFGKLSASAIESIHFAKAYKKHWLHIDLETEKNPSNILRKWLSQFNIKVLNVTGRNASRIPELKKSVNDIISLALNR